MLSASSDTRVCPFCNRPLDLAKQRSGKIGCSRCRNIFFYDASSGVLTPLAPANTQIREKKAAKDKRILLRQRLPLLSGVFILLALALFLCFVQPWASKRPHIGEPEAVMDEVSNHLKSLAE